MLLKHKPDLNPDKKFKHNITTFQNTHPILMNKTYNHDFTVAKVMYSEALFNEVHVRHGGDN
jgi:hypothetical protein